MESSFQSNDNISPQNGGGSNNTKIKKTRYRVPTVCSVCRRRKMKCDKAKPYCSSCVKNNTTHLCVYEEQPWASSNEIQKLKDQVFALQNQNNELKGLLSKKADNENQSLIIPDQPSVDPILELTKDFNVLVLKESKMSHFGSTSFMAVVTNDLVLREMFKKYLLSQNWGINFNRFFLYDQGIESNDTDLCSALPTPNPYQKGSVFESDLNKDHKGLIDQINDFLPSREIILDLIDHFFAESYAFVPYIDEKSFRHNMEALISVKPNGNASLVVNSASLFVSVGLLLAVLRFSFITLPANKEISPNLSFKAQKILNSGVSIDPSYIEYAKACLGNAGALRKPTLKHIQALLILKLYRYFAPEDGDESTDSTIFLALIVQMAKMHGLHRDPNSFSLISDPATANIWRKIWTILMHLDAIQAYTFGCPLLIDDEYDTLLPVPNSNDSALERNCIDWLKKIHEVTMLYREIVKSTSKIKDLPKRSDIENTLKQIEFAIQRYPDVSELTSVSNEGFLRKVSKIKDLSIKLNLYTLHACTYYLLTLTCAPDETEIIHKYLKKATESCFINFKLFSEYSSDIGKFNQGLNFESYISSILFDFSKRTFQIIISLTIRDLMQLISIGKLLENPQFSDSIGLVEWLRPFSPGLSYGDQCIVRLIQAGDSISRLQHRYFSCWRMLSFMKMFFDNINIQFVGKHEMLVAKIAEYDSSTTSPNENILGTPMTPNDEQKISSLWNSFVDSANQSKFDFLVPDLEKFKNVPDPFFNDMEFGATDRFTFQDYNSLLANTSLDIAANTANPLAESLTNPSLFTTPSDFNSIFGGSNATKNSISTSDGISPNTDPSSEVSHLQNNSIENDSFNQVNIPDNMEQKESVFTRNNAFEEHELALQVAKSMFPQNEFFDNDYI